MALPASRPLLALLLLAASLLAEGSVWDDPSCTGDALTVPRGQPAVMTCNMSNPLTHVAIRLRAPGEASRLIFAVDGPGHFSNNGWQLEVRGGEARLVIPDAQPAQAGDYTWHLEGRQRSVRHTSLSVSDPPLAMADRPEPPSTRPAVSLAIVLLAVVAVVLVVAALAWHRRRRSRNLGRIRQMRMFPAPGPSPEGVGGQSRLAPGVQPA